MDADDVAFRTRLQRQVPMMAADPTLILLGCHVDVTDGDGRRLTTWRFPTSDALIRWTLLFENCFAHPAVMFRRDVVRAAGGYTPGTWAEDYDLWIKLLPHGRFAQVPDVLHRHRLTQTGNFARHRSRHIARILELMGQQARALGLFPSPEVIDWLLTGATRGDPLPSADALRAAADMVRRYLDAVTPTIESATSRDEVRRDAASRLFSLAAANVTTMPALAMRLALDGLTMSPRGLGQRRVGAALKKSVLAFVRVGSA